MKKIFAILIILHVTLFAFAQQVQNIAPPNWWVGMHNPNLQLMIHGDNIAANDVHIHYPGVTVYKTTTVENPDYIFLDLVIAPDTKPGTIQIEFVQGKNAFNYPYTLEARTTRNFNYGLDGGDFIYLLMPDRFANGDVSNDIISTMLEKDIDRSSIVKRHGGDLQGIINHLDYIQQLGATAIWTTPMLANDQPLYSYHGYAITDHYNIDPRIGTNALYKKYVDECHKRNIKVVLDIVHNHVGDRNQFIQDMPMPDWVNQWDTFTRTNYRIASLHDPYASDADKKMMSSGWFDTQMPDLNQRNPFVATYLIQNNIWWVEYAHVDAFRLDTYPYSDLEFLESWKKAIDDEYPGFGFFAEVMVNDIGVQGYFAGNNSMQTGFNSNLPGLVDFTLQKSIIHGLNESFGWVEGVRRIYNTLAQDYVYGSAYENIIFISNHDENRLYSAFNKNLEKSKMATAFIMTTRGIPQWYYGDEILFEGYVNPLDALRPDFPGGWPGDTINKFDPNNLKGIEKEFHTYVSTLANWRKDNPAIVDGKLMQFLPENGVYVYFRYTNDACVMVLLNSNITDTQVDTKRFSERMDTYTKGKNVITGEMFQSLQTISIPKQSAVIIELKK